MITRRHLLEGGATLLLASCKRADASPDACADTAALAPDDAKARATLGYVDATTQVDKSCSACTQFIAPPADGQCGSCKLVKGPIHPRGYCKAFAAKG
jgi:hypothetical protein